MGLFRIVYARKTFLVALSSTIGQSCYDCLLSSGFIAGNIALISFKDYSMILTRFDIIVVQSSSKNLHLCNRSRDIYIGFSKYLIEKLNAIESSPSSNFHQKLSPNMSKRPYLSGCD